MVHSKKNPNRNFKNSKPCNQGSTYCNDDASNMVSNQKKCIIFINIVEKINTLNRFTLNGDANF